MGPGTGGIFCLFFGCNKEGKAIHTLWNTCRREQTRKQGVYGRNDTNKRGKFRQLSAWMERNSDLPNEAVDRFPIDGESSTLKERETFCSSLPNLLFFH